jgi:hypothetical protein
LIPERAIIIGTKVIIILVYESAVKVEENLKLKIVVYLKVMAMP